MSAFLHVLPGVACAGLMGIPMAIGMIRGRLRGGGRTLSREPTRGDGDASKGFP